MKNIITNLPTLQHEKILPPWLRIFKTFQSQGCNVFVNTGPFVKKLETIGDVYDFDWLAEEEKGLLEKDKTVTKFGFLLHSLKRNLLVLKNSSKVFTAGRFDVVYTPSTVLDFVAYPYYLKVIGKKIGWATTLANIVPISDPGNKILRFLGWIFFQLSVLMIKKADVVFASTPELKGYLLRRGFDPKKIVETSFAVESDMIQKAKEGEKKIDALFVGRINETKGIYDMLKALKIITGRYPDFQFAIMGDGDEKTKTRFKKEMKKLDLSKNVQFLGYRDGIEKYNIIKSAKCFWFLSVSRSESFGMALLEAVCSGIPSFAYNLPQFSWLYPNGEVDISPKGDYKLVAEKVLTLFENGNFSNEKGKLLLGKYNWESVAEKEYNAIKKMFH